MAMVKIVPEDAVERLKNEGFLLIQLTEQARMALASTFEAAYPFFRATLDEKSSNTLSEDLGYRPKGIEYSQSPERPDPIESFTADVRTRAVINDLPSARARLLYKRMQATINVLEPIAEALTMLLADALSVGEIGEKLHGAFRRWSCLQVNYSQPANTPEAFINELHEDGHLITLSCSDGPGLEVQTRRGDFARITTADDEILVMPGEIVWLLSGGQIRPLYHQVRRESSCRERLAILFFGDIDPKFCEPWVKNKVNKGVDIGARVLTNAARFGLNGFPLE
jgi:isopenicillin N synthase-like dioxygenase